MFALELVAYSQTRSSALNNQPVIGICNGFQPGQINPPGRGSNPDLQRQVFECRWITLLPQSQKCVWTRGLSEPVYCPVAHGEGKFLLEQPEMAAGLQANDQITGLFRQGYRAPTARLWISPVYCNSRGMSDVPARSRYPLASTLGKAKRSGSGLRLIDNSVHCHPL
jgi:hypothetical protein